MKTLLQMTFLLTVLPGLTAARAEYFDREASSLQAMREARAEAERRVYGDGDADYGAPESYSDLLIHQSAREESQPCGIWQGRMERQVITRTYRRDNGSTYQSTDYGIWSSCRS